MTAAALCLGALVVAFGTSRERSGPTASARPAAAADRLSAAYGKLPLRFEANRGQTEKQVSFLSRGAGYTLFLTPREAVLSLTRTESGSGPATERTRAAVLRTRLLGADPEPRVEGLDRQAGRTNYLKGTDRSAWRTNVPGFSRVRYRSVYPGIDLVYHGRQGTLEYDFVVKPGGDPRRIALGFSGAQRVAIDRKGDLVLSTPAGAVRQKRPVLYQTVAGQRRPITGRYVMNGRARVGFQIGRYDRTRPLTIDPVMVYSTYLGGGGAERVEDLAVDAAGSAYLTGTTSSLDFPTAGSPALDTTRGGLEDIFVAKLNPQGSALAYSTYLGGARADRGTGIAVGPGGRAYVTGLNGPPGTADFPTTANAFRQTAQGSCDGTLSVFNAQGTGLDYSTYLGGSGCEGEGSAAGLRVAVDAAGMAYVTGDTESTNFPTTPGAYLTSAPDGGDAFVTKIDPGAAGAASLVASTYLGGSDFDVPEGGIAVDPTGAYVSGLTFSTDFPTGSAFDSQANGNGDAFVTKLDTALASVSYSTYLGGTGTDIAADIAVDAAQRAYVAGYTDSDDFSTQSPFQAERRGAQDGFVTKLDPGGSSLAYSSYLGGAAANTTDSFAAVAVDAAGSAYVTGTTRSDDLPTVDAVAPRARGFDHYVAKVRPDGSGLSFASFLGGGADDVFERIPVAVHADGAAYLAGTIDSTDFPTQSPLQADSAGRGGIDRSDAYVAKLAPDPAGAPYVTGVAPLSGPAGTRVTVTGRGFTGATQVRFGAEPAASVTVESHDEITAVAPAHADGAAAVTVTRAAGTSPPNPIARFVYAQGTWRTTGAPTAPVADPDRDGRSATVLRDGRVLVVSKGYAELYDPATGDWTQTGTPVAARQRHTATLLGAPACSSAAPPAFCGQVLVQGGGVSTAELYDPATGTWAATGTATAPAGQAQTATLLPDGRVLVLGGQPLGGGNPTQSAEIYDPATGVWSPAAPPGSTRADHTATLITGPACTASAPPVTCGRVLVAGGVQAGGQPNQLTQLYDPATNSWRDTEQLPQVRQRHSTTTLPDGRIMLAGGDIGNASIASVQVYSPADETWAQGAPLRTERASHLAIALGDGRVLVTGGLTGISSLRTAEVYDPAAAQWRPAGVMSRYRYLPNLIAAALPGGDVLVAGTERLAELYRPAAVTGAPSPPPPPPQLPPQDVLPILEPPAGPAPAITPASDREPPTVRDVRVLDRSFQIGSLLPLLARQSRVGTTIRFALSEPATARLTFARARPGRRVGATCRTATPRRRSRPRCTRYVAVHPSVSIRGARAGTNSVRFQGRLTRTRALRPGRYRLTVSATDPAGNRSAPKTATFTLLRAPRTRTR